MTAPELLSNLAGRGFILLPQANGIKVTPWSLLKPDDQDALRKHKPEVMALLLIREALAVRERFNWSPNPATAQEQMAAMDRIDEAFMAGDHRGVCDAVERFRRLMVR